MLDTWQRIPQFIHLFGNLIGGKPNAVLALVDFGGDYPIAMAAFFSITLVLFMLPLIVGVSLLTHDPNAAKSATYQAVDPLTKRGDRKTIVVAHAMNQAPHRALPIVSPFVAKLDVTLRHAKIPFAYAQVAMDKLPTGKMPTLHWNGTILSDSQLIVDALVKEGIMAQHPDAWMDPETRAVANMFRFSLETLPYGGLGIERWIDHWPSTRDLYFHKASWFFRYIFFPIVIRPKIVSNFKKTGILGYPMQARDDMIESFWEDASTLLGTKRYFFSENHMSTSDFAAFGFLFNFLAFKELTPKQSAAICKHQNLIQFVERVKKELYPEILTDAQAIESKKDK